jgi:hypothetical protein
LSRNAETYGFRTFPFFWGKIDLNNNTIYFPTEQKPTVSAPSLFSGGKIDLNNNTIYFLNNGIIGLD